MTRVLTPATVAGSGGTHLEDERLPRAHRGKGGRESERLRVE
jgi:hypothetical protein